MLEKNIPYVKQYDADGTLVNPIKDRLINMYPTRKERRVYLSKAPFIGCSKNYPLVVIKDFKYRKVKQIAYTKSGDKHIIEHYLLN